MLEKDAPSSIEAKTEQLRHDAATDETISDSDDEEEEEEEEEDEVLSALSDCYLVSPAQRKFPSVRAVLALNSKLLANLILACGSNGHSEDGKDKKMEIPMVDDSEEDVKLLWRLCHGKLDLSCELGRVTVSDSKSLERICSLAKLADKYDMQRTLKAIENFFFQQTDNLLPRFFPQLWKMACEYGWDAVVKNLEKYARQASISRLPNELPTALEEAFATMSTHGRLRAASSLMALLRGATSSLTDMCCHYERLRSRTSCRLHNFKLKGLCSECKAKVSERACKVEDALRTEFPGLKNM